MKVNIIDAESQMSKLVRAVADSSEIQALIDDIRLAVDENYITPEKLGKVLQLIYEAVIKPASQNEVDAILALFKN